jgi:hypothetical protein
MGESTVVYLFLISYGRTKQDQLPIVIPKLLQVCIFACTPTSCLTVAGLQRPRPTRARPSHPHHVLHPRPARDRGPLRPTPALPQGQGRVRTQDCSDMRCEGVHGRPTPRRTGRVRRDAARPPPRRERNSHCERGRRALRDWRPSGWGILQAQFGSREQTDCCAGREL